MKRILFTLISLLYSSSLLQAQVSGDKRIEIELKNGYASEKVIKFGKNGFLLLAHDIDEKKQEVWKVDLYNTDLTITKTAFIKQAKNYLFDESFVVDNTLYILFKEWKKEGYTILSLDIPSLEIKTIKGKMLKKSYIKDMVIMDGFAYFNATLKKQKYLLSVNLNTGKQEYIPIQIERINSKKVSLSSFEVLKESKKLYVYASVTLNKKNKDVYIIQLDNQGKKEKVFQLTSDIEENINSISTSELDSDRRIFSGTYSKRSAYSSEGMFFAQSQGNGLTSIKFHNFLDLDNFLSYLPEKKQKRMERKKERKGDKGKEMKINYLLATHHIIELPDGFLFLAEAYYPTYRQERQASMGPNGQQMISYVSVFDGYQYTHAVITKFDKKGDLIWDETFELWQTYKPYSPKKFISVAGTSQNAIKLAFTSRNKIHSKSISFEGETLVDATSDELETKYDTDKTKWSLSEIDYWYDNYFMSYGMQKIKNKDEKGVKKKRKVYFVNKIAFE